MGLREKTETEDSTVVVLFFLWSMMAEGREGGCVGKGME
uniref:Uncharacterized protein n=1 Tax=Faecalibaculum rodentium TaxID=1702221 RepID=A0A140DXF9_9FIRM|nr:hypothetical protein AALO17_22020 [Faecalibaculum rodentium]